MSIPAYANYSWLGPRNAHLHLKKYMCEGRSNTFWSQWCCLGYKCQTFPWCEGMAYEEMPHGEDEIGDGHQLGMTQDLLILGNSAVKDTSVILALQNMLWNTSARGGFVCGRVFADKYVLTAQNDVCLQFLFFFLFVCFCFTWCSDRRLKSAKHDINHVFTAEKSRSPNVKYIDDNMITTP